MRDALVVGKPNVGKTLFILNFAAYLGVPSVAVDMVNAEGMVIQRHWPIDRARRYLVSAEPHKTLALQHLELEVPTGKTRRTLTMVDTTGITEGIPEEAAIRAGMAQTLAELGSGDLVLHVIDASVAGDEQRPSAVGPVDDEIAAYASQVGPYAVLANKMDKAGAEEGLKAIQARFSRFPIIPVAAINRSGFREVKAYVLRHWSR